MTLVKIIIGSTRPNRFGPTIGNWLLDLSQNHPETKFELVDVKDLDLPLFDEPASPAMAPVTGENAKKWTKMVGEADGFVFVTAEYNHGYPASLKNAIDYVSKEWGFKPVAFASYGSEAGGSRAVEQLRIVSAWLNMFDLKDFVIIPSYWTQFDETGKWIPTDQQTADAHRVLKNIGFWAENLKPLREKFLAQK